SSSKSTDSITVTRSTPSSLRHTLAPSTPFSLPCLRTFEQSENVGGDWRCSRQGQARAPTDVSQEPTMFVLADEASGYGNRGSGEEVAIKLRNIMNQFPEEYVFIDFENVDTPSASFLDEFLAKTMKQEGVTSFFSRCRFVNMNAFVRQTADAVIG